MTCIVTSQALCTCGIQYEHDVMFPLLDSLLILSIQGEDRVIHGEYSSWSQYRLQEEGSLVINHL
jgi:hypothetical protein